MKNTQEFRAKANEQMRRDVEKLKFYWNTEEEVLNRLEYVIEKAKEVSPVEMPTQIVIELQDTGSDNDMCAKYDTFSILALIQYLKHGPITAEHEIAEQDAGRILH